MFKFMFESFDVIVVESIVFKLRELFSFILLNFVNGNFVILLSLNMI